MVISRPLMTLAAAYGVPAESKSSHAGEIRRG